MASAKAAAINKLRPVASVAVVGASLAAISALPALRHKLAEVLSAPGVGWKAVALAMVALNLKDVPFVWHIRLFRALLYHLYFQPTELPKEALFLPVITQSYTPMLEMDYNLHKSNSTYFADLDIARTHLVTAVLRKGIRGVGKFPENKGNHGWSFMNTSRSAKRRKDGMTAEERAQDELEEREREEAAAKEEALIKTLKSPIKSLSASTAAESGLNTPSGVHTPTRVPSQPTLETTRSPSQSPSRKSAWGTSRMTEEEWWTEATKPGNLLIALGGNSCHYHREIPPYKRFEIWTRILAWDRKWIYIVSHFVEKDAFKPSAYILQPWKTGKSVVQKDGERRTYSAEERARLKKKIYASSISKYVVKKGRLTIPPELVLMRSEMLPERPPNAPSTFLPTTAKSDSPANDSPSSSKTLDVLEESLFASEHDSSEWTWDKVERMRVQGMKLAGMFDALDGLRDCFDDGSEGGAMGHYPDLVGNIYG